MSGLQKVIIYSLPADPIHSTLKACNGHFVNLFFQEGGIGCVKVIDNADFSWMETETAVDEVAPIKKLSATHPRALILEPTRELAIQVKNHLLAAAKYTDIKVDANKIL